MASERSRLPTPLQAAVLVFVLTWFYGWVMSQLSEGWMLFSLVPVTAAVVVFIAKGGIDA